MRRKADRIRETGRIQLDYVRFSISSESRTPDSEIPEPQRVGRAACPKAFFSSNLLTGPDSSPARVRLSLLAERYGPSQQIQ